MYDVCMLQSCDVIYLVPGISNGNVPLMNVNGCWLVWSERFMLCLNNNNSLDMIYGIYDDNINTAGPRLSGHRLL